MWNELRTPQWIARIVAMVGGLTVFSAALPAMRHRVHLVVEVLPAVFPSAATTGALALGAILILLSRSLRRGKYRAWVLSTVLTAITVVVHLVKGFDVEEAVITFALFLLLVSARKNFTARPDPRSLVRVAWLGVTAPIVATALGVLWLMSDADGRDPASLWQLIEHSFVGLVGIEGPVHFIDATDYDRASVALTVLGGAVLFILLLALMMPKGGPHPLSVEEEGSVRKILDSWGTVDSLSYFATRADRSVIFSKSGKSAITYKVVGTVSLAAGDPIGDPEAWPGAIEAWLCEAKSFGWVPAVLGVSEQGATAFNRAGMDALELGDEAVLDVLTFSLEGRSMRVVRQAVARCDRAGLVTTCHRVADLDEAAREEIRRKADEWRDGDVERGFSMALGRYADPRDGASVLVLCRDNNGAGELRGLLNLVPWGTDGLSLDLMRRDRETENGIVEHMVAALCAEAPAIGVTRISLNFAVFRSVFARGERLGAGPVHRLWHAVLLGLSRFWQIESLYRANAKYQPEWVPRFLCFKRAGDLPRVATAALRAEAFIVAPSWFTKLAVRR
jgi:lysyl-tRNA synthetase class 2